MLCSLKRMSRGITASLAAGAAMCFSGAAFAGLIPPLDVFLTVNDGAPIHFTPQGTSNPNGTFTYNGYYASDEWEFNLAEAVYNPDPSISAVIGFTNNTLLTNTYTLDFLVPASIVGPTFMGGSVGGSLTDANFSGSALVTSGSGPGTFLYQGIIDGALYPTAGLYPSPTPFAVVIAGETTNIPATSFGLPLGTFPGPVTGVTTNIGIRLQFSLSPGDSIAMTSLFVVEPIPGPGALALLAVGGILGSRRRRR